ncbi:MAG: diacylglycerol kinase family protein [Balneolaceae bacterium]|nr:diacylglycerol kinase family protein [Balneolaceae bacterium]
MKRYLFIHNPAANRYRSSDDFKKVIDIARQEIKNCEFIVSKKRGDIQQIVEEQALNFDVIVACGGDGTVRETAIATLDWDICLGVVPLGSGNDVTKSLQIPTDLKKAILLLKNGKRTNIDVGYCNEIPFINSLGFGFDGLTNQYASKSRITNGTLRYIISALKANFNRNIYKVKISFKDRSDVSTEVMMITAANGRIEGGNFCIAPDASITDARLDIVLLKPISKWLLPLKLPFFLNGSHTVFKEVEIFKTQNCIINFDKPVEIHADGEVIKSKETEFDIRVESAMLSVISGHGQ